MTKEEFEQYEVLNEKFHNECERVRTELERYNILSFPKDDIYTLYYGDVYCTASDFRYDYDGTPIYQVFDTDFLFYTDDELKEYINGILKKREEEKKSKQELIDKQQREKELKEYQRLKEKFENQ